MFTLSKKSSNFKTFYPLEKIRHFQNFSYKKKSPLFRELILKDKGYIEKKKESVYNNILKETEKVKGKVKNNEQENKQREREKRKKNYPYP